MVRSRAQQAAPPLTGLLMNLPPLRDEHVKTVGFYVGAYMEDTEKPWRGFALYHSFNQSTGYVKVGEFPLRAVTGLASTIPLGSSIIDYRLIDRASSITIELQHPDYELESVSEDEMLAGRNRFLVGNEIIGAANVTLVSTDAYTKLKTYQLSVLLRGIKDTFDKMDSHVVNQMVVWLDGPGIYFYPHAASSVGLTSYYKFISGGGTLVEAFPLPMTPTGASIKPFRPVSIKGTRNGGNDITITWERQPRQSTQLMQQGTPYNEELERYKILVRQSALSDIAVREAIVLIESGGTRTWTYTSSQQTSDGFIPGTDPITFELRQMSSILQDDSNISVVTI